MQQLGYSFKISIADICIHLHSETIIELESGYIPFLADENATPEIDAVCFDKIPAIDLNKMSLAFEARNENQRFYSIYKSEKGLCFAIYNQQNINEIQQIAYLNPDFTQWVIYSNGRMALKYPMGPIIMHYLTLYTDAVLMHASCAFDGEKGRMFSGFSGVGKSTMSKIWASSGAQIINDDRLIIRKVDNQFLVYNTPMYYDDDSKKCPLSAIYLISHSPENKILKVKGALAVSKVMAFCIQNNFEREFISKRLQLFAEICSAADIYELGFVPTSEVIDFVKEYGT